MKAPSNRRVLSACGCLVAFGACTAPALAEISITPRIGVYFDNVTQRQSGIDYNTPASQNLVNTIVAAAQASGLTASAEPARNARNSTQLAFPQYGGTVTFDWRGSESTQVALTALYGKTTGDATQVVIQGFNYGAPGLTIRDTLNRTTLGDGDFSRLDLEATVQHRVNETFSLVGGLRAERAKSRFDETATVSMTTNVFNFLVDVENQARAQLGLPLRPPLYFVNQAVDQAVESWSSWSYSARFGGAAYAPIGDRQLFYVNGLLQYSYRPKVTDTIASSTTGTVSARQPSETFLGPDISVGYMYRLSDRFGIDLRYRATVYFPISGPNDFKDARVNHGAGLGFTTWFGGR
jgi:hypothetical protein